MQEEDPGISKQVAGVQTSPRPDEENKQKRDQEREQFITSLNQRGRALRKAQPRVFWPWLGGILVVALVLGMVVTFAVWGWLNGVQHVLTAVPSQKNTVATFDVQRSATYADLQFTVKQVQSAATFSDDTIRMGAVTARVMIVVKNPTPNASALAYYDIMRLLLPGQQPIAPTNLTLPATIASGATQSGWIDFPLTKDLALNTLQLRLGNAATHEVLVTIPMSGTYNPNQFSDHLYHTSVTMDYYYAGYHLVYHLKSVDVRYAYNGVEGNIGQQLYVLNFTVDNPNGVWVGPGYGFDYIRLILSNNLPPIYNTLPNGFKAYAQGTGGSVTYAAPSGLHTLNIALLYQLSAGEYTYSVSF